MPKRKQGSFLRPAALMSKMEPEILGSHCSRPFKRGTRGTQIPTSHTAVSSRAAAAGLVRSFEVAQGITWGFQVRKGEHQG
jgi:hypothetical protein